MYAVVKGENLKMLKFVGARVVAPAVLKDEKSAWQPERPSRLRSRVSIYTRQWFFRTFGEAMHAAPTNGLFSMPGYSFL